MKNQEDWKVVSNKKTKLNNIDQKADNLIVLQNNIIKTNDPIISRQKEVEAKVAADKQEFKQIKYEEQKDPTQDWNYITLNKSKPKSKIFQPQREITVSKEITNCNGDTDIKIKKVSKIMAKAVIDARVAKKWTQIQLAHNSSIDIKTISEIERCGNYDANIFNKLCKTLGIQIERNYDLV